MRSKDYKYLWHPFTLFDEWLKEDILIIDWAQGIYLYDSKGKKYIDGVSSLWSNIHGHNVPELNNAITQQLDKVAHTTFLGLSHEPAINLAEKLISVLPQGLSRVFYSDSGSEAVEAGLKMAFQYWQQSGKRASKKKMFVTLSEAYHGDTIGSVSLGSIQLFHNVYGPLLFKTIKAPTTYAYRCKKATTLDDCGAHCLEEIEAILKKKHDQIAALVIEPLIQGAGGMIIQPKGFVKEIRRLCTKYDVLMIADEVATGFGRTGKMFAVEHENVSPDIIALGKGLTGGYLPLAATITTEEIFKKFRGDFSKTFFHGHTYTANPLACAVASASLELFEKNKVLEKLADKISLFQKLLSSFNEIPIVGQVRQCGLIAGIELVADKASKKPFDPKLRFGRRISIHARKYGIIIRPLGDVLVILPPLAINQTEIVTLVSAVKKSIFETKHQILS